MVKHDAIYKELFAHPRMVKDLLEGFVHEPWIASLDFSTLERLSASFIAGDQQRRESDMVWRAKLGDDWVYLYLILEFQSSVDADMGLRLLVYTGLLLQDLIKSKVIPSGGPYPPVIPFVFYTGERRWQTPTTLSAQRPPLPTELAAYQLECRYVVLDEGRFPESELPGPGNLAGLVVRAEQGAGTDAAHRVLRSLLLHLRDPEFAELKRAFLSWSGALLKIDPNDIDQARLEAAIIEEDPNMLRTILAQEHQQIRQTAKQEGRQEGRLEAALAMLSPVLELRFGPLPPAARERIASATVDDIDRWTARLFTAPSLNDVLND